MVVVSRAERMILADSCKLKKYIVSMSNISRIAVFSSSWFLFCLRDPPPGCPASIAIYLHPSISKEYVGVCEM